MRIESPTSLRIVEDYDICFESGMILPFTVDKSIGDSIEINDLFVKVNLVASQSPNDPDRTLPAREVTVFVSKIASIEKRTREVVALTSDQKAEWHKTFKELSKTIQ